MAQILVIDDSRVQRAVARLALQEEGHEVTEAEDGETGVELALRESPDCILLDLFLPDLSGCDVLRRFHEDGVQCPVIVLSADDPGERRDECLELGAVMVIEKPRDSNELALAVKRVLTN